jgi:cellulose synthase operon protein C
MIAFSWRVLRNVPCVSACAVFVPVLLLAQTPPRVRQTAIPSNTPAALVQRGAYADAIAAVEAALRTTDTPHTADLVALTHALTAVGRPADAIARTAHAASNTAVASARARAFEHLGRLFEADTAWTIALRGPDSLRARVERLRLEGERSGTRSVLQRLEALLERETARGGVRTGSDLHALASAARLSGAGNPERFKDALQLFDRALAIEPTRLDARAELGEMFLEKFNFADARATLSQVLSVNPNHPQALAAMVRLGELDGQRASLDPLPRLLAVNPASAMGHTLMARRLIDAEQYATAATSAQAGLMVDSGAPGPWTMIAAARWLVSDTTGFHAALSRAHQRLTGSAAAEVTLAELAARNRLYADAVTFARAGLARDTSNARALAVYGINLLRTGEVNAGRTALTRAFELDPYDVWVKNTLDLLDTYAAARTVATQHFDLVIEPSDADLLALYAEPVAEAAYAALTSRYGYTPPQRIRVEFFRNHADFSVRAVGLSGLGALGVAFGHVLAIDAPPARPRGEFNWQAVLWHEFTHTITLGMTNNRVPRWVSEGLSVHEERRARAEWGGGITPQLIAAYGAGQLRPVSQLNDGFVHPRYAQEVILSYALAAYVFEMLEARRGIDGIRALLAGYRDGGQTPQLMRAVYALEPAALDSAFDGWFRTKFAREFAAVRGKVSPAPDGSMRTEIVGSFPDTLAAAHAALRARNWRGAVQAASRAVQLFPDFTEAGSGYHVLATAHLALGDTARAAAAIASIATRNGEAIDENILLADLLPTLGDSSVTQAALSRAVAIDPFDTKLQTRLGDLAFARRVWPDAVRARRAVVAMAPTDRADALYRLAQALAAAGDLPAARTEVLRALDLAPNFEVAQDLLLSIRSSLRTP